MRAISFVTMVGLLALSGCGQPREPAPASPASVTSPPQTAASALVTPEIAAKIAALPAPYNEADYVNGRRAYAQCRSCHLLDPEAGNTVGPNLHGVFHRKAATTPNFPYSPAMKSANWQWDMETLDKWIANPQKDLPGTRMTFAGMRDPNQRRDLIAYLKIETE